LADEYLQLKLNFDAIQLQQDLVKWQNANWLNHFNKAVNKNGWAALPLRSPGGSTESISASADINAYADTYYLAQSPYFARVMKAFKCKKHSVRLLALAPDTQIKRHTDHELSFEDGLARIHIPIKTHSKVKFILAEQRLRPREGESWYINANYPHSVNNTSKLTRVHLVMDCQVNPWLTEQFKLAGYRKPEVIYKYGEPSINDKNVYEVIAGLKALNTDTSHAMAERLSQMAK